MFKEVDRGNSRIYYKVGKILVCFQEAVDRVSFDYLMCSSDGEPSHPIKLTSSALKWLQKPSDKGLLVNRFWSYIERKRDEVHSAEST